MSTRTHRPDISLVHLQPAQLRTHPRNMRRFYPVKQVEEMAASIRGVGGLIEPLIVTPDGQPGVYYVICGNMRLAGAHALGPECPPLKAEIVGTDTAEQLLAMAVENTVRYEVDPISEGLHYARLVSEDLSVSEISKRTGVYESRIRGRLHLLDLDQPIQELVASDLLPHDGRAVNALLSIPDPAARVKLARRLARPGITIKAIQAACDNLARQLTPAASVDAGSIPALVLASPPGAASPSPSRPVPISTLRHAAAAMCSCCDIFETTLTSRVSEPAWSLVARTAGATCQNCSLRDSLRDLSVCQSCPGVEMLRRLLPRPLVPQP